MDTTIYLTPSPLNPNHSYQAIGASMALDVVPKSQRSPVRTFRVRSRWASILIQHPWELQPQSGGFGQARLSVWMLLLRIRKDSLLTGQA